MKIVIVDYDAGNVQSVKFAVERLGFSAVLTKDISEIKHSDKVIFPGVGNAGNAMEKLKMNQLDELIPQLKQPVLGICLGMQLMCKSSEESNVKGLGIFNTEVVRFSEGVKVPQIGWNTIYDLKSTLFSGISENEYTYFVHGYYAPICEDTIATTDYGKPFSAALHRQNFYGVQFHPEKSSDTGAKILSNFLHTI